MPGYHPAAAQVDINTTKSSGLWIMQSLWLPNNNFRAEQCFMIILIIKSSIVTA